MNEVGLGEALQRARKHKGLTQQQLCQVTGLSYSTLAKIERGAIKSPSIFTVVEIARALGASLDEIMGNVTSEHFGHDVTLQKPSKRTAKNGVQFVYFDINGCLITHHAAFTMISQDSGIGAEQVEYIYWQYNDRLCRGEMTISELNAIMSKELQLPDFSWQKYYINSVEAINPLQDLVVEVEKEFKIGLLTNIMEGQVEALLEAGKLPKLPYEQIIDSSKVGMIKPDRLIFELATEATGLQPEQILFIDDTRANLSAASQLGWRTLWFDTYNPEQSIAKIQKALE